MLSIFRVILIVFAVFCLALFTIESVYFTRGLDEYCHFGIPTHPIVVNSVIDICNSGIIHQQHFSFIDIGSGSGQLLSTVSAHTQFLSYKGIEFDAENHALALSRKVNKVEFIHADALSYKYEGHPMVVYLYEPFFSFKYKDAIRYYNTLFHKILKSKTLVYIIYVSGMLGFGRQDLLTSNMFETHGLQIIMQCRRGTILRKWKITVATNRKTEQAQKVRSKSLTSCCSVRLSPLVGSRWETPGGGCDTS